MTPSLADHDLFVSYAHADDGGGWVAALIAVLQEIHNRFSPRPWHVFYDRRALRTGDDWDDSIGAALRSAGVMLAVLSPAYFASAYCRKEWEVFREQETRRGPPETWIIPLCLEIE
ncbi:MAG TPA: toll/interleukin-1 receptor domain-containing protein, partial [Gemmataceae bacterium]|nr:toll/interleukin-1 receptor domain-containing protein [Gemmataceae bacterium]